MKTFKQFHEVNEAQSLAGWAIKTAAEKFKKNKIAASPKLQKRAKAEAQRNRIRAAAKRKKVEASKSFKQRTSERLKFKTVHNLRNRISNALNVHKRIASAVQNPIKRIATKVVHKAVDLLSK